MNHHKELAKSYFLKGYNCAQSVVLAFHEELGLDEETAARMASAFGGGMGRLREVCGTVSGMFLVLGLLKGYHEPKDQEGKKALYAQVQQLPFRSRTEVSSAGSFWASIILLILPFPLPVPQSITGNAPVPTWLLTQQISWKNT